MNTLQRYMVLNSLLLVVIPVMSQQKEDKEIKLNEGKHSKKCTFYTLRFGCSFAAVNTIKPQLL